LLFTNINIKIHRIIILPVVVYGCKTWSLALREGCGLRMLENRVLGRIFGPKRDEVTGERRKLYNEVLNDQYSSPNINRVIKSRKLRWAGHAVPVEAGRGTYMVWWENLRERIAWKTQA
jgi:hypothetical protein